MLNDLPTDMVHLIASFLNPNEIARLKVVNKNLSQQLTKEALWKQAFERFFPNKVKSSDKTYYQAFKLHYTAALGLVWSEIGHVKREKKLQGRTEQDAKLRVKHFWSDALRNSREFILAAIKQDVRAFKGAGERLQADRGFVLEVMKKNPMALKFVLPLFKNDKEIVLVALKQDIKAFVHAGEQLQADRSFILEMVQRDGLILEFVPPKFKKDEEIALTAIKQNASAFLHIAHQLKTYKSFVLEAVKRNGKVLALVHWDIKKDANEITFAAVAQNPKALKYADLSYELMEKLKRVANSQNDSHAGETGNQLFQQALMKDNVQTAVNAYNYKQANASFKFSIFHGEKGLNRANAFNQRIQEKTNLFDLMHEISQYLYNNDNGNTRPESFRTILLMEMLKDRMTGLSREFVSNEFHSLLDHYFQGYWDISRSITPSNNNNAM